MRSSGRRRAGAARVGDRRWRAFGPPGTPSRGVSRPAVPLGRSWFPSLGNAIALLFRAFEKRAPLAFARHMGFVRLALWPRPVPSDMWLASVYARPVTAS